MSLHIWHQRLDLKWPLRRKPARAPPRQDRRRDRNDVIFQMAEVAIPRQMFQEILRLIAELRPQPPRQHETFDSHAFKSNRQKECVQMPGRWPDQTLDQAFGLPEVLGAVSTSRLVLQEGRENANIDAGLGFIWRISVEGSRSAWGHLMERARRRRWVRLASRVCPVAGHGPRGNATDRGCRAVYLP